MPMTFLEPRVVPAMLAELGVAPPPAGRGAQDLVRQMDAFLYHVLRALLDATRMVTPQRTVQPEHVYTLRQVAAQLGRPVTAGPAPVGRLRGGGGGGLGEIVATVDGVRPAMHADPAFFQLRQLQQQQGGGGCGCGATAAAAAPAGAQRGGHGGTVFPIQYFRPDAAPSAYSAAPQAGGGGGGGPGVEAALSGDAMDAMVREYRSRCGATDLRVSEPARHLLRQLVLGNLRALLLRARRGGGGGGEAAKAKRKEASGKGRKALSPAAFAKAAASWRLVLD